VEVDKFGRALAYWIRQRHPGDLRGRTETTDRFERVPADDIYHLRIIDRWPQTRGEPWMHTALRKLDDVNEYSGSELQAARAQAYAFATIETPAGEGNPLADDEIGDQQVMNIEPLMVQALAPGEKLEYHTPTRPNTALDPFIRHMLREIAAGTGPSYESISRDYSQSNYSSSRLALLEDRDLWRSLQLWWLRNFRRPLHQIWLQQAVFAGAVAALPVAQYAIDTAKYEAVLFKPRGWSWIDPTKEVTAYKEAVKAGLTTLTDVIAQTAGGLDIEDVIATRKRELELLEEAGVVVDTTVLEPAPAAAAAPASTADPPDEAEEPPDGDASAQPKKTNDPHPRVVSFGRP
jgi:lambda family phage portal protein